jgi:hypothetical protein
VHQDGDNAAEGKPNVTVGGKPLLDEDRSRPDKVGRAGSLHTLSEQRTTVEKRQRASGMIPEDRREPTGVSCSCGGNVYSVRR